MPSLVRICVGLSSAVFKICDLPSLVKVSYNLRPEVHCRQSAVCKCQLPPFVWELFLRYCCCCCCCFFFFRVFFVSVADFSFSLLGILVPATEGHFNLTDYIILLFIYSHQPGLNLDQKPGVING